MWWSDTMVTAGIFMVFYLSCIRATNYHTPEQVHIALGGEAFYTVPRDILISCITGVLDQS